MGTWSGAAARDRPKCAVEHVYARGWLRAFGAGGRETCGRTVHVPVGVGRRNPPGPRRGRE
jgi:hypothetical protein